MSDAIELAANAAYYNEHKALIEEVLDGTLERLRDQREDREAMDLMGEAGIFAAVATALAGHSRDRAITLAAAAVVRLSQTDGVL